MLPVLSARGSHGQVFFSAFEFVHFEFDGVFVPGPVEADDEAGAAVEESELEDVADEETPEGPGGESGEQEFDGGVAFGWFGFEDGGKGAALFDAEGGFDVGVAVVALEPGGPSGGEGFMDDGLFDVFEAAFVRAFLLAVADVDESHAAAADDSELPVGEVAGVFEPASVEHEFPADAEAGEIVVGALDVLVEGGGEVGRGLFVGVEE